ncbi:MAG: restriction endonuclease [Dehalococcoidia bacterium]
MLWPTLLALQHIGGSGTIVEIEDRAIELAGFTEEQQNALHGGGPRTEIRYRLAWARTDLGAVGALENSSRGVWAITEYGRSLQESEMARIPSRARAQSGRSPAVSKREPGQDLKRPEGFSSTVPEDWRDRLLTALQSIPPSSFERLCQRVLRESGFTRVDVTGRSGDGGIDGIGVLRISLLSFQVFFQCKRYKGSVGASAIRDFRGAMVGRTDKGLLITTGSFTPDAKREATRDGAPVLDLIDGEQLCGILKDLKLGVGTQQVEEVSVDATWFDKL